jgi:hypothetical protein
VVLGWGDRVIAIIDFLQVKLIFFSQQAMIQAQSVHRQQFEE